MSFCRICKAPSKKGMPTLLIPTKQYVREKLVSFLICEELMKKEILEGQWKGRKVCYKHAPGWQAWKVSNTLSKCEIVYWIRLRDGDWGGWGEGGWGFVTSIYARKMENKKWEILYFQARWSQKDEGLPEQRIADMLARAQAKKSTEKVKF